MAKRQPSRIRDSQIPDKSGWLDNPFLTRVREHFRLSAEYSEGYRREAQIDQQFKALQQWPEHIKKARINAQRPCLTFDQINPAIRQQTNLQRKANQAIQVSPEHDGDEDTAEVFQGLVRGVENGRIKAAPAYDWAFEDMISLGRGWVEICAEYTDDETGDQILTIKRKINSFAIYSDPFAVEPHDEDGRFLIEITDIPQSDYRRKYPTSMLASLTDFTAIGNELPQGQQGDWFPNNQIRIAKYWYLDYEEKPYSQDDVDADGAPKKKEWTTREPIVKVAVVNAVEVLEGNQAKTEGEIWGQHIPVIPDTGEEYYLDGKRCFRGIIRAARDPQTTYNFERTGLTEAVALAKTAVWLADARQIEPYRAIWESQTTNNLTYLPYATVVAEDGRQVPKPERVSVGPPMEGIVLGINLAKQDLRSTTNYYDPTDPSRANTEQSGRAILARKEESMEGGAHFLDNHTHFLIRVGTVLLPLLAQRYDRTGRKARLTGKDDQPKTVLLNQPFMRDQDGNPQPVNPQQPPPQGTEVEHYDIKHFKGVVSVGVGTSFATRRQEGADFGLKLMDALPNQAPLFAHIVVGEMDGPGHRQIAEILKKALPPQFQDDKGKPQIPPEVQAQMQQMGQTVDLLTKELNAKNEYIEREQFKVDADLKKSELDNKTKVEIAHISSDTQIAVAASKQSIVDMQERVAAVEAMLGREHEMQARTADQQHQREMAERGHAQELETGEQAHGQEMEAAQMSHSQNLEAQAQAAALQPPPQAGA